MQSTERLLESIDNYFNNVLKLSHGYPEIFKITITGNRIILTTTQHSQLIDRFKNDNYRKRLEDSLLSGIKQSDSI